MDDDTIRLIGLVTVYSGLLAILLLGWIAIGWILTRIWGLF